jgi:hypothetical protein
LLLEISTLLHFIGGVAYLLLIIYLMISETRLLIRMKKQYFYRFWSYIEAILIVCAWAYVVIVLWRYMEYRRITDRFIETNGYVYVNLQLAAYMTDVLSILLGISAYFGTIRCLRFCRYHSRLSLFTNTLVRASRALVSFGVMFSVIFVAFLMLFYLLFASSLSTCTSLLHTAATLFEMTLWKINAQELLHVNGWLGPLASVLFVLVVMFVCMSMFVSIIADAFRSTRQQQNNELDGVFRLIWQRILSTISKHDWCLTRTYPCVSLFDDERLWRTDQ